MFNVDAARGANLAPFVSVSLENIALALAPVAAAFFVQPTSSSPAFASQTFLRSTSRFLEQAPKFTPPKANLWGSNPLLIGVLLFGGTLLIHELLSRNNLRPSPDCERLGQVCSIPPQELLAP